MRSTPDDVGGPFELVVADLSFISLTLVMPVLAELLLPGGDLVVLVKPQFEVGRDRLGKTGVVRSQERASEAVECARDAAAVRADRAGGRAQPCGRLRQRGVLPLGAAMNPPIDRPEPHRAAAAGGARHAGS